MGDHEDVALIEDAGGQRTLDVGLDDKVAVAQGLGGEPVGGVGRMRRLHRQRRFGSDRPGLAVSLVEQDAWAR